ncbi:hypothetical protein D3C80_1251020 [compost metagenome]
MAEQAEAGHVGHGLDPVQLAETAARLVQRAHQVARHMLVRRAQQALLLGGGEDADAQWLGQVQLAAFAGGVVTLHEALFHQACDSQAENRLRRIDRMPTGQRNTRRIAHRAAATNHFTGHFRRQHVDRPTQDRDRHQWVAAHGVDVADGVGGGNTAEIERIVDDRHEKVSGGNHAAFFINRIHGCIITRGIADP